MRLSSKIRTEPLSLAFAVFGGLVLLFIVAPLISMFVRCSPGELAETAKDAEVRNSIWLTLWTSMAATVIFAVAAIPFAYLLARKDFPLKRLVTAIIDLPVVIPHSAAGIALLGVISRSGFLGKAAGKIGFSFVGSAAGIMVAMAFVSIPYLINSARDGFLAVDERLEKAALNLGANPLRVFLTVSVPLAARPIGSGLILMWARGMSEFGAVLIIAYHPMITPVLIYERFGAFGLKYARPVAALFVLVCLMLFIALRLLSREKVDVEH
jgi:molybdate/tungstate transport system permease protein